MESHQLLLTRSTRSARSLLGFARSAMALLDELLVASLGGGPLVPSKQGSYRDGGFCS